MPKKPTSYTAAYFKQQGSKGGKLGGAKSWANLTKAERSARATKASKAAAVKRSLKKRAKDANG